MTAETSPRVRAVEWPNLSIRPGAAAEWKALSAALAGLGEPPLCQSDPETWFSDADSDDGRQGQAFAAKVCGLCPARGPCLAYAVAGDERYGIWGGLTARERINAKRRASRGPESRSKAITGSAA